MTDKTFKLDDMTEQESEAFRDEMWDKAQPILTKREADNLTRQGVSANSPAIPGWATFSDFEKLASIHVAASEVHTAKIAFVLALQSLHEDHPEHPTPGDLLVAFGIDPHDFDGCL